MLPLHLAHLTSYWHKIALNFVFGNPLNHTHTYMHTKGNRFVGTITCNRTYPWYDSIVWSQQMRWVHRTFKHQFCPTCGWFKNLLFMSNGKQYMCVCVCVFRLMGCKMEPSTIGNLRRRTSSPAHQPWQKQGSVKKIRYPKRRDLLLL